MKKSGKSLKTTISPSSIFSTILGRMTDAELRDVVRSQGIVKGKEAKSVGREKMIELVLLRSKRRLHQGAALLS